MTPALLVAPEYRSGDLVTGDTAELLRALDAVRQHLPHTVDDILRGQMTPDRQHEFADLLIDLGKLLHRDAATNPASHTVVAIDTQPPLPTPNVVAHEEEQP